MLPTKMSKRLQHDEEGPAEARDKQSKKDKKETGRANHKKKNLTTSYCMQT